MTLGKYGSALGFEREDPTSLYTFSRAYCIDLDNDGADGSNHYSTSVMLTTMLLKVLPSHTEMTPSQSVLHSKMH